jgi:hypothetical protein
MRKLNSDNQERTPPSITSPSPPLLPFTHNNNNHLHPNLSAHLDLSLDLDPDPDPTSHLSRSIFTVATVANIRNGSQ